jgi:esterase/lipase
MTIKYIGVYYTGTFVNYSSDRGDIAVNFDNAKIIYKEEEKFIRKIRFYEESCRTYHCVDFQKEKIQDAMEHRAVNKILQKITGDDTFNYN